MRKIVRTIAIISCFTLPLGLFGSSDNTGSETSAKADRKLAEDIQESVAKDDSLHPSSRKIEVTVRNGVFVLNGIVQSDAESQEIQGRAESEVIQHTPDELIATVNRKIDNELVVAPQS